MRLGPLLLLTLPLAWARGGTATGPVGEVTTANVTRIIDGDTVEVVTGAGTQRVRFIGIDTPEVKGATAALGAEATAVTRELLEGRAVVLEKDVSEVDRYGRLLRYVWLHEDGWTLVNEELVRRGFAQPETWPPDVRYADRFVAAQREARDAGRGLWGTAPAVTAGCDASYPTVCIPPLPPDLDCGQIPHRRFQVVPPDPHGFDIDHDGVGCEGSP